MATAKEAACPFCDELAALVTKFEERRVEPVWAVVCRHCEGQGPKEDSPEEALEAWADRPPAELDEEQVLALLQGLLADGVKRRLGIG